MSWIQTRDNQKFDLLNPRPESIDPNTLAIVLGRICRFGSHCGPFYSVAQHSLAVESLVEDVALKLPALLHDAHEAYWGFGDVLRPAKCMDPQLESLLRAHTKKIDAVIAERFGFQPDLFYHESIKHADNVMLATEKRDVMGPQPEEWTSLPEPIPYYVVPLENPEAAADLFYYRLVELMG